MKGQHSFYGFVLVLFVSGLNLVTARDARILNQNNGWDRSPVTEMAQNFSAYSPPPHITESFQIPSEQNQLPTYQIPPSTLRIPDTPHTSPELAHHKSHTQSSPSSHNPHHNFVASELDPVYHESPPLVPSPPSHPPELVVTENKYASEGVDGKLNVKSNGYKINTISTASQEGTGRRRRKPSVQTKLRKVNMEKFKECIFFRLCEKASCFHYGRFGICQGRPNGR